MVRSVQVKYGLGPFKTVSPIIYQFRGVGSTVPEMSCNVWSPARIWPRHGCKCAQQPISINPIILVVRAFVRIREMLSAHADLARKMDEIEKKYDAQFKAVFDAIRQLMRPPQTPPRQIGFHAKPER